jgi:hypothetical protein
VTDPNDIDPATANWLAARLEPAVNDPSTDLATTAKRTHAKRLAREVFAHPWDAGWLIEDPRKKE